MTLLEIGAIGFSSLLGMLGIFTARESTHLATRAFAQSSKAKEYAEAALLGQPAPDDLRSKREVKLRQALVDVKELTDQFKISCAYDHPNVGAFKALIYQRVRVALESDDRA